MHSRNETSSRLPPLRAARLAMLSIKERVDQVWRRDRWMALARSEQGLLILAFVPLPHSQSWEQAAGDSSDVCMFGCEHRRDVGWYCTVCNKFADWAHLLSSKHCWAAYNAFHTLFGVDPPSRSLQDGVDPTLPSLAEVAATSSLGRGDSSGVSMSCGVMSGGVGTPMLENSVPSGVSTSQQPAEVRLRTVRRGMGRGPLESRHDEPAPEAAPPGLDWIDAQPWVGPSGEGWLQDDSSHDTTPMLENAVAEAEVQMAHEVTHESLPLPEDYEDRAEPAADSRDPVASMLRSIDEGGGQPGPRNHERSRSRSRRVPRQPTVPPPLVPRQPTVPPPPHMARQETTGEKQSRWA